MSKGKKDLETNENNSELKNNKKKRMSKKKRKVIIRMSLWPGNRKMGKFHKSGSIWGTHGPPLGYYCRRNQCSQYPDRELGHRG
jgi:hypothetical protein